MYVYTCIYVGVCVSMSDVLRVWGLYVYICVCVRGIDARVRLSACMYVSMYVCVGGRMHMYACTIQTHLSAHTYTQTCMHAHLHACMWLYQ